MDSSLHGVPLSATQMPPMAPPSNNTISGIRAPLTVDESDFEYSKSRRNSITSSYYSNSELESEGFVSGGEDDFTETASEKPYVTDQDEEVLEQPHFLREYAFHKPPVIKPIGEIVPTNSYSNEYGFSRPSVRSPDEAFPQESGGVNANAIFRPFVGNPDERAFKGVSDDVNDSDDSRSFLSESGDEFVEDENYVANRPLVVVKEEENVENGPTPILDSKVPVVQMLHIPIAKISGDSDDDSQGSEVSEVEGFLDIVRVPSFEVLHRINSTPKVRMLEDDEGDDIESQAENMVETEFVEDLVISNGVLGPKDETEHIGVQDIINSVMSSDTVQDRGADVNEEVKVSSLVVNEKKYMEFVEDLVISNGVLGPEDEKEHIGVEDTIHYVISSDTVQDRGPDVNEEAKANALVVDEHKYMEFVEDLVISNGVLGPEDEKEHIDVEDTINCVISFDTVQDRGPDVNAEARANSLVVNEQYNSISESGQNGDLLHLDEEIQEIDVTDDQKKCVDLVDEDIKSSSAGLEDNLVFNQDVESEKLETDSEQEIDQTEDANLTSNDACQSVFESVKLDRENWREAENSEELPCEVENSTFQADANAMVDETERERNSITLSDGEILLDYAQEIDCRIMTDSDDSAFYPKSVDGTENFSLESNTADLGSIFSSARPVIEARTPEEALSEREKQQLEKTHQIRVKYFRLLHRLGRSPEDSVASKVLFQLSIAEMKCSSQTFHLDSAEKAAMELEAQRKDDLGFSLCILVIGKTGVGKSATINSIFGESKTTVNAFEPSTTRVKEIIGKIDGVKVKVFDTPGLRNSLKDQPKNRKILSSVKKLMKKSPPDVILYVDRLDTQSDNLNDLPLLKLVTSYLGSSMWRKSVLAFTHATSVPPDGPDGYPLSCEVFIAQQSQGVQQLIRELLGLNDDSMIPISLVENHPFAKKNENGETLLHNGESWRSNLLFLCYSIKTLSEVNIQNPLDQRKFIDLQIRSQLLTRPVFESQNWDRDFDYDGVLIEDKLEIAGRFPAVISVQLTKDKKECNFQLHSSVLTKRGDHGTFGKNKKLSYILKGETKIRKNKTAAGVSINVSAGLNNKLSGKISIKTNCSDQLQIAAMAFLPIARAMFIKIFGQSSGDY